MNAMKYYAWNLEDYQFLNESNAPPSVNPSLWRQERLNNLNGLFQVKAGQIYQVRSYELATMSFIKTDHGWIVLDPLSSRETARAGLALLRANISQAPVVAIICSHSHMDHFGGVSGILQAEGKSIATDATPAGSTGKILFYAPSGFYERPSRRTSTSETRCSGARTTCTGVISPVAHFGHVDRVWARRQASARRKFTSLPWRLLKTGQ